MGQYYILVNLSTGEYVHPHEVGDGAKLMEIAYSTGGLMTALTVLLASGNGRGNGDIRCDHPLVGRWAGDRIVLAGDYDDAELYCHDFATALGAAYRTEQNLYNFAREIGKNITPEVFECFSAAGERFGAGV